MQRFTTEDMRIGLIRDGAIPAPTSENDLPPSRPGYRLIAGFISPESNGDFHFYRQETDGLWTHKPAKTEVQNLDARGVRITDPRLADRDYRNVVINGFKWPLNYSQFAGFFYVPENGLRTGKAATPQPSNLFPLRKELGFKLTINFAARREF